MIHRKTWNMSRLIFILFLSQNFHNALSGPLKNDNMIETTTELVSKDHKDYDESSSLKSSTLGSARMFGNVLPHSNVPVEAVNNNQIIFGNVLPNSNPSITTSDENINQMNQNSQLSNTNPLSTLQPMTGNVLPHSNPSVNAGNNNQVLFGNFLPNSKPVLSSTNGAQGGQLPSLSDLNPISGLQNNLNSLAGIQNSLNQASAVPNNLTSVSGVQNNLTPLTGTLNNSDSPAGVFENNNPQSSVQNGLSVGDFNMKPSRDAASNGIIGTSPVLLLGTQQALLIPISSVPSIFQTMLSGLMPTGNTQPGGVGLPQLSNIKVW